MKFFEKESYRDVNLYVKKLNDVPINVEVWLYNDMYCWSWETIK